jgi:hypothetical protein
VQLLEQVVVVVVSMQDQIYLMVVQEVVAEVLTLQLVLPLVELQTLAVVAEVEPKVHEFRVETVVQV